MGGDKYAEARAFCSNNHPDQEVAAAAAAAAV